MMMTLGEFERVYGVHKGTVSKRARAAGFNTSAGLSPEAVKAMKAEFGITEPPQQAEPPQQEPVPTTPVEILEGNHRGELMLPQQPSTIDLGQYREEAPLTDFRPEDITRFLEGCDGFLSAVEADFQKQQAITEQKEAAAAAVRAKVEQVRQAKLLYQVRSEALSLHNRSIDAELQQGMTVLGKPQQPPAADPPQ
jgi:hypothetical protein